MSTPGTQGYERVATKFIELAGSLQFDITHKDFLPFLPAAGAQILDAGCGAGQDAAALAELGYQVTAVEPMPAFLSAAQARYAGLGIAWFSDSLPQLSSLDHLTEKVDFILVSGVWHHLNEQERDQAMSRLSALLVPGGVCGITLRNGPAGGGTHTFATDLAATKQLAQHCGLESRLELENQASVMPNKRDVIWSRIVLMKPLG